MERAYVDCAKRVEFICLCEGKVSLCSTHSIEHMKEKQYSYELFSNAVYSLTSSDKEDIGKILIVLEREHRKSINKINEESWIGCNE